MSRPRSRPFRVMKMRPMRGYGGLGDGRSFGSAFWGAAAALEPSLCAASWCRNGSETHGGLRCPGRVATTEDGTKTTPLT
jgi:hypothetical protein